ncbi:PAS domain S-box-containing protein [Pigmentiphaga litoralis]|uniref:histidine kinase n=1 Tax=Pigmentiphaga litoralis TaxID=516702 RepID=A0A7Y9LMF4_9BURK|nr:PAS domain S-box protein [Pigmentiphaga litoralis]NYE22818.1 PAS domain S-box-containing protein [Pigmentiphaga litoralis]NYE83567.1 PAS domain S-box-containing protein [Pigmentiphaga litoralis]
MSSTTPPNIPAPFREHVRLRRRSWYWLTPAIALGLFVCVMGSILWWLDARDDAQRYGTLVRDVDWAQQSMRLRMLAARDRIGALGRDLVRTNMNEGRFLDDARELLTEHPEIIHVAWLDADRRAQWISTPERRASQSFRMSTPGVSDPGAVMAFEIARNEHRPTYSRPYQGQYNEVYVDLYLPVFQNERFLGNLAAVYSVDSMLQQLIPQETGRKYKVSILDGEDRTLVSSSSRADKAAVNAYEVPLDPPGNGMVLRAHAYRTTTETSQTMLVWVVVSLSAVIIWSLLALWRHTRFRSQAEEALIAETGFRRAMENAILTGMRVIDMEGRITYVNPAFCRMMGWNESDLIGRAPPYPYWPQGDHEAQQRAIDMLLSGNAPSSGFEMEAQRRDGSIYWTRMYVSPLLDQRGVQTGWMTSMTDITEPKRIREALAAAHERFMTVLEGLDDAISVTAESAKGSELLFANKTYRRVLGSQATGHDELSAGRRGRFTDEAIEVYSSSTQRWFEVRHRMLQWSDGRRVRMQVARDITERRASEEASRAQQEKIQLTSRLITMGEMASSLAHELNQPLTAIANYSMGVVALVRAGVTDSTKLLPALEKTTAQAERAGMIIRRIREFVKRSEPKRKRVNLLTIVDNAVGFAGIDSRPKRIDIVKKIPEQLPDVLADPILIEQVLLNLLKNGLEAMQETAGRELLVEANLREDMVEVAVTDTGHGLGDPERLFEPFYSTKPEGMGMGLNICRTIIEFHHGRLWAEPNPDGGTIFRFTLPWVRPLVATGPAQEQESAPKELTE